jgi:glutaredoxin
MRLTTALRQHALRLTLFTRSNCSLCVTAKDVLANMWDKRHFEYDEIDVMASGQSQWKKLYEFDTPVVGVDRDPDNITMLNHHRCTLTGAATMPPRRQLSQGS